MSDDHVLVLDVGGTSIKTGFVFADGTFVESERVPTARNQGAAAVVERVVATAWERAREGEQRFGRPPVAAGVASLGLVDERAGVAMASAAVGWTDVPLRALVAARLQRPVFLAHDIRAAALAEARRGAAAGAAVLFVAIGTGVGAAMLLDGVPQRGAHARAGELGHVVVRPGGPPCGCGRRGCVEAVASAAAIERDHAARTGRTLTAREICGLADEGDVDARAVLADAMAALADGLAVAQLLLDPGLVVIGGGLSLGGAVVLHPLGAALARALDGHGPVPDVAAAALGDGAACVGAGLLAWDHVRAAR